MSAAILSPERFANLRASLLHHALDRWNPNGCSLVNRSLFAVFDLDPAAPGARTDLRHAVNAAICDWHRLNLNAFLIDNPGSKRRSAQPPGSGKVLPLPALLKAMQALEYNCGDIAKNGEVLQSSFALLCLLIDTLKNIVIQQMPEYQSAEWAI